MVGSGFVSPFHGSWHLGGALVPRALPWADLPRPLRAEGLDVGRTGHARLRVCRMQKHRADQDFRLRAKRWPSEHFPFCVERFSLRAPALFVAQ